MFDVNDLEVIKGSQGVLFGKNTSIGAISIDSKRPSGSFGGYIAGSYEAEYGSYNAEGAVNLPLTDTLKVRLSALYDDQEGYVHNVTLSRDEPDQTRWVARAMVDWDPSPTVNVLLKLQASRLDTLGTAFEWLDTTSPATLQYLGVADGGSVPYQKYESSAPLGDQKETQKSVDPALIIKAALGGGYTLTTTSGFSHYTYGYGFDSDSTPAPLVYSHFYEDFSQFSQEVRIASPVGKTFDFIVGAFFLDQSDTFDYDNSFLNFGIVPGDPALQLTGLVHQHFKQTDDAYAGFGQLVWHITPRLDFTVGGRLSYEGKDGAYVKTIPTLFGSTTTILPYAVPLGSTTGKVDDTTLDGSATLSYKLTEGSVLYGSIGRGSKAGAFNNTSLLTAPLPAPFTLPKEEATTYEAGIKGRFLEGRGYAGLSAFYIDVSDFQDSYYSALAQGFLIRSIGASTAGVEGEGQFQATPWLNLYGNFAATPKAELADGERMQRAPRFTAVLGARTSNALTPDLDLQSTLQVSHSSSYYNQPPLAPGNNESGTFDLLDARLAFVYHPAKLEFYVSGENLTDDRYRTFSFGSPLGIGTVGTYNRPRTITLGVKKSF